VLKSNNIQQQYESGACSKPGQVSILHNNAAGTETMNYILVNGTSNNIHTGVCVLSAGSSTTINDANIYSGSKIFLQAISLDGFNKFPCITSKSNGSFDIAHAPASGDEFFFYVIFNANSEDNIYLGSGTLTSGISTTVNDANATTASTILLQSTNTMASYAYWRLNGKNNGSFTIATNSVAGTETFDYIILNI
jgi:hypothetical protein